jgi:hypothetical protein
MEIDELKKQISILTTPVTSAESTLTSDAAQELKNLFINRNTLDKLEEV